MALQLSPALLVYLSFFASNYKIPCRSTSIMYELSLDMVTVLHSPTVDRMLRRGFLLPSQGVLSQLSVEPTAARLVYVC